jgi:hypothetical protein
MQQAGVFQNLSCNFSRRIELEDAEGLEDLTVRVCRRVIYAGHVEEHPEIASALDDRSRLHLIDIIAADVVAVRDQSPFVRERNDGRTAACAPVCVVDGIHGRRLTPEDTANVHRCECSIVHFTQVDLDHAAKRISLVQEPSRLPYRPSRLR